jgi:hypothetical protein
MKRLIVLLMGLMLLAPSAANAAGRFGKSEEIDRIAPVALVGPSGEHLFLAHKVTTLWFMAGVYMKDDGYVLGVEGQDKAYYALPPEKMALAQKAGLLPNPLPAYEIQPIQYLLGYSLWIVLVFVIAWGMIKAAWDKSRAVSRRAKTGPMVI